MQQKPEFFLKKTMFFMLLVAVEAVNQPLSEGHLDEPQSKEQTTSGFE